MATEELSPIDICFGRFLREQAEPGLSHLLAATGVLLSRARSRGHSRILLADHAGQNGLPDAAEWGGKLRSSRLVTDGSAPAPLVYDGANTVSLYRYWNAERQLARHLLRRAALAPEANLPAAFSTLFPDASGAEPDWQALAAAAALRHRLSVICGGPGTGKTTTVARIIRLLREREPNLEIALAAPTGKAAARLEASLAEQGLPLPARTVHSLLGYRRGAFRHHAGRPLTAGALIVDEASMIDLLLMLALFEAAEEGCRIILLGDPGQLASVEAGCVLADIAAAATGPADAAFTAALQTRGVTLPPEGCFCALDDTHPTEAAPLAGHVVELRKNWRFASQPGIGALAAGLRMGQIDPQALQKKYPADLALLPPEEEAIREFLRPQVSALFSAAQAGDAEGALAVLQASRVLCAARLGTRGVERINRLAAGLLREAGQPAGRPGGYEPGQPVLIERNDYDLGLMNGETGVCLPAGDGSRELFACFPGGRRIGVNALPPHTTAWALTVHKSQGSEFDRVLLLLPELTSPLLCRELVYTGATRARRHLTVLAAPSELAAAAANPALRRSGLLAQLLRADKV